MIDLASIVQTTEHALTLLEDVSRLIPGGKGLAFQAALAAVRASLNLGGILGELQEIQATYSAQAQDIADAWPTEPTKPE